MGARLAEIIERALGLAQQGGEGAGLQRTIAKIRRVVPGGGAHGGIPRMQLDLAFLGRIGQGVDPGLVDQPERRGADAERPGRLRQLERG